MNMEEGPEPQELMEQTEHAHHQAEHGGGEHEEAGGHASFTTRCAITASALAVLAALASLLSGHAANEAILDQSRATDQWAYYQAKSTKSHIIEGNEYVIKALGGTNEASKPGIDKALGELEKLTKKYEAEQDKIHEEAKALEDESTLEFRKHQDFSYAVALFQIGIVLASISIMVKSKPLYMGSIVGGAIGIALAVMGQLQH
jgi:hypothetical protein